jgi:hypothetical protein
LSLLAALSVTVAGLSCLGCSAWAAKSRRKIRSLWVSPAASEGDRSEVELERRSALGEMTSALLQIRGAARISLASGTGCALLALSDALSSGLPRGLPVAVGCFVLGATGAGIAGHFGRVAKEERARFRDEWNAQTRKMRGM